VRAIAKLQLVVPVSPRLNLAAAHVAQATPFGDIPLMLARQLYSPFMLLELECTSPKFCDAQSHSLEFAHVCTTIITLNQISPPTNNHTNGRHHQMGMNINNISNNNGK